MSAKDLSPKTDKAGGWKLPEGCIKSSDKKL